jgi:hypothetical protein
MKNLVKSLLRFSMTILVLVVCLKGQCQSPMPDALFKSPVQVQITAILDRTKVFENYRAIREDMFQKLIGNLSDSVKTSSEKIKTLTSSTEFLRHKVDSLTEALKATSENLEMAITTKNSFSVFGKEIRKNAYNAILWIIILGLAGLASVSLLLYTRNNVMTQTTHKELQDLKDEFQAYRKAAREAKEKMSMDHFNELKRLRSGK